MKYKYDCIFVPKWVSYRTYFLNSNKSRTYVNNERMHTYLQLDGKSSDFYYYLTNKNFSLFNKFISDNKLVNEIDDFIEKLFLQDIIGIEKKHINSEEYYPIVHSSNEIDNNEYVVNRNKWLYENGFLPSLFIELTYRCNLKCIHCYNPKNMGDKEIPFNRLKRIIDDAYNIGVFEITISGGESTTHSRFIDIVEYITSKHMSLVIFTNGQNLFDDLTLYKRVIDCYPHQVCVSLYSNISHRHDNVTQIDGSFEKTYSLLKKLSLDNINIQIKNFLLGPNCKDCYEVAKYGNSIGAETIADISLIPTIEGDKKTFKYIVKEPDLFSLFSDKKSPLYIGDKEINIDINKIRNSSLCLGGFTSLCISPNLDINVCVSLPRPLGNLYNESLETIWNDAVNKKANSTLYQWQSLTINDLNDCYKYEYCKFCNYCAGMAFLENGFLKKSDVLCMQAKAKMKAYRYIQKTLDCRKRGKIDAIR